MAEPKEKRANNSKVLMIVGGAVAVVAVAVGVFFLVKGNNMSMSELRQAMIDKKAVNCTVTKKDSEKEKITFQATEGFGEVRFAVLTEEAGDETQYILKTKDGTYYMWNESGSNAYKMSGSEQMDSLIDEITSEDDDDEDDPDEDYEVKCESIGKADFSVPKDINFQSFDSMMNIYDDIDWDEYDYGDE